MKNNRKENLVVVYILDYKNDIVILNLEMSLTRSSFLECLLEVTVPVAVLILCSFVVAMSVTI